MLRKRTTPNPNRSRRDRKWQVLTSASGLHRVPTPMLVIFRDHGVAFFSTPFPFQFSNPLFVKMVVSGRPPPGPCTTECGAYPPSSPTLLHFQTTRFSCPAGMLCGLANKLERGELSVVGSGRLTVLHGRSVLPTSIYSRKCSRANLSCPRCALRQTRSHSVRLMMAHHRPGAAHGAGSFPRARDAVDLTDATIDNARPVVAGVGSVHAPTERAPEPPSPCSRVVAAGVPP
ncbi:hypothetical protein C8Q78DRAFT_130201 [Trametes maxima]|nr:hypothetical protein C8Q78DRAFT_130201 [Trametes maxima]